MTLKIDIYKKYVYTKIEGLDNMKPKYKKIIIFTIFLIAIFVILGVTHKFYNKETNNNTEVVVVDELSINFDNGYNISQDGDYKFSIANSDSKKIYFQIAYSDMNSYNPHITFDLLSTDSNINIINHKLETDNTVLADNIVIDAKETQNFTLRVSNIETANFKIKIKKIEDSEEYFNTTILKNNKINNQTITKIGEIATANEGLIEDADDYGLTYYFRGAVENNYINLADMLWRIVRINGDGSVKLILNNSITDLAKYNEDITKYENFTETDINKSLSSFYELKLKNYDNYITSTKFCNESIKTEIKNEYIYNPYTRIITNNIPSFNCLGDAYSGKIGLMTADEVVYAGANFKETNKEFYLYSEDIKDSWWVSSLAKSSASNYYPFSITTDGKITDTNSGTNYNGVRPVINLNRKVIVKGKGTKNEPYEIITE